MGENRKQEEELVDVISCHITCREIGKESKRRERRKEKKVMGALSRKSP